MQSDDKAKTLCSNDIVIEGGISRLLQLLEHVTSHSGMFFADESYDSFATLVWGMDMAANGKLLEGINDWYTKKTRKRSPFPVCDRLEYDSRKANPNVKDIELMERYFAEIKDFHEGK
ncbi:hypothetical protein [Roseovarius sp. 2305UL8-3]|uniref:hypothetical protein n=1 Tax=Roseovarius conchicola TaxID=3121636 RepID=UPI0035274595